MGPSPLLAPVIKIFLPCLLHLKELKEAENQRKAKLYNFLCKKYLHNLNALNRGQQSRRKIREILIDETIEKLCAQTELLLNFAARKEHVEKIKIKPALSNKNSNLRPLFDSTFCPSRLCFWT